MRTPRGRFRERVDIKQTANPDFVGAPALVLEANDVGSNTFEIRDQYGALMFRFIGNSGVAWFFDASGNLIARLGGNTGLIVGAVSFAPTGGGLHVVPFAPGAEGSDAIFIDGTELDATTGAATFHIVNPIKDMPDAFYVGGSGPFSLNGDFTINADMDNAAPKILFKGKTTTGRVVTANIPLA
jgi:hypothetical protein